MDDVTRFDPRSDLVDGATLTSNDAGEVAGSGSMARQMWRVFRQNKLAVASMIYLIFIILGVIFIPLMEPSSYWRFARIMVTTNSCYDFHSVPGYTGNAGPTAHHLLGCIKGYDTVALLFYAGRFSLAIGFLASVVTMTLGVFYGMVSGYRGGRVDAVMMRFIDMMLSIPGLYLLILVITLFGHTFSALIIVIGFTGWFGVARLMRAETQTLRERDYVQAARSMGATQGRILYRHILPNAMSTMVTMSTFALGDGILILSSIGYLGFGLTPPQFDWGSMIQNASGVFQLGYWWTLWPCATLFILFVLATNYIGDALRDAFEVRLQER
jgi:peptide/nickel transport system permease protein